MEEIKNFMRSKIISIDGESTVHEGAESMLNNNVSSLLVMENENYVGIVTEVDLVRRVVAKGLDPKAEKMKTIMSHPLITMDHYLTRLDANDFMFQKRIKHLAITKNGKVVGMVTRKNLMR